MKKAKKKTVIKNLTKVCCINNCKSKNGAENVSYFPVPRDDGLFNTWAQAVSYTGTILNKQSFLCEKHFYHEQIKKKKTFILKDKEGNILLRVRNQRKSLQKSIKIKKSANL